MGVIGGEDFSGPEGSDGVVEGVGVKVEGDSIRECFS